MSMFIRSRWLSRSPGNAVNDVGVEKFISNLNLKFLRILAIQGWTWTMYKVSL
jgi:hypothetical protein